MLVSFCTSYFYWFVLFMILLSSSFFFFFFFNDTATTEIYTLSLHDALPIPSTSPCSTTPCCASRPGDAMRRSEEHTSELQSHVNLVCRLLLEKKKKTKRNTNINTHKNKTELNPPIKRILEYTGPTNNSTGTP